MIADESAGSQDRKQVQAAAPGRGAPAAGSQKKPPAALADLDVVILCGGLGTRLREETEIKPKPMVEIGGRPIIWHIMKIYSRFGLRNFILCLGYKGEILRDYFLNYRYNRSDFAVDLHSSSVDVFGNAPLENWRVVLAEPVTWRRPVRASARP